MSDLLSPWVEGLARGVVQVPRCAACGAWNWYPGPVCHACRGCDFSWCDVGSSGRIHTWTRVVRAVDPVQGLEAPYVTALVQPDAAPEIRIPMRSGMSELPAVGQPVRFRVVDTPAGHAIEFSQHMC